MIVIYEICDRERYGRVRRRKRAQTDARHIIWALDVWVFFFFVFFLILIILLLHTYVCNLRNIQKGERWRAATAEKGPNDSSRVVWALGECFFFLPSYFLILIYVLSHIQLSIYKTYDRNRRRLRRHRQERAQTKPHASFRPRWVFFSINNLYLITYTAFNLQNTQSREMEGGDDEEGFK